MSGKDDKQACGVDGADLTAFVWDGSSGPARGEDRDETRDEARDEVREELRENIKHHLASCPDCAAEVEALKEAREAARIVASAAVPPTAGFHEKLMARVRDAAGRATPRGGATPAGGTRARGPASRRLAEIAEREKVLVALFRPRWKMLCLATAAAACLGVVFLTRFIAVRTGGSPDGIAQVDGERGGAYHNRVIAVRFKERRECAERMDYTETALEGSSLDVAGMFRGAEVKGVGVTDGVTEGVTVGVIEGEELVVTGVIDLSQQERCLMAFRAADWQDFRIRGEGASKRGEAGPERERFRAVAEAKQDVPVREGRIDVPQALLAKYVTGAPGETPSPGIVILRLRGRTEIWGREQFKRYMRAGVPHQIGVELETLGFAPSRRLTPQRRAAAFPATATPSRHDRPA